MINESEIKRSYRNAKNPKKQIQVLADLYATSVDDIKRIVKDEPVKKPKSNRDYVCRCGVCGDFHKRSEMIRTYKSPNNWMCQDCIRMEHPEYDCEEW